MTFVGKILVVVNVVLTICIAMFAAGVHAVQTNWKAKAESEKKAGEDRIRILNGNLKDANDKLAKKTKEADTFRTERDDVKNDLITIQKTLSDVQQSAKARDNALKIEKDQYNLLDTQLKSLQKQKAAVDAALKTAQVDNGKLVKNISDLLTLKHELERKERDLKRNHGKLVKEYVAARNLLAAYDIEWDPEKALLLAAKPKPAEGSRRRRAARRTRQSHAGGSFRRQRRRRITIGGRSLYVYRLANKSKFLGKSGNRIRHRRPGRRHAGRRSQKWRHQEGRQCLRKALSKNRNPISTSACCSSPSPPSSPGACSSCWS